MGTQRTKRRANLNQSLSCLTRVFNDLEKGIGPLSKDEFYTFYACAAYIGKINGLHNRRSKEHKQADGSDD